MYECDDVRIGDCCHSKQTWQTITRNRFDYGDFILQIWCTVGSKWHLIAILLLAFCAYDCGISTRCLVCPGIWFGMAYLQTAHRIHRYHLPLVSLNDSSTAPRKMLSLSLFDSPLNGLTISDCVFGDRSLNLSKVDRLIISEDREDPISPRQFRLAMF